MNHVSTIFTIHCLVLTLCAVILLTPTQDVIGQVIPQDQNGCAYLEKKKPSIFISYERETTGQNSKGQDVRQVLLRLHNNSSCTIVIETDDMCCDETLFKKEISQLPNGNILTKYIPNPPEGALLLIFYDLQETKNKAWRPANYWEGRDLVFRYTIPPGRSVIFRVEEKYFRKRFLISVPFNYAWEENAELSTFGTITHRVAYAYDLL